MLDTILTEFPKYFPEINGVIAAGIPVFARVAGLMRTAPFLKRTEIPVIARTGFALILTVILCLFLKPEMPTGQNSMLYSIIVNFICGAIIGFIINCIVLAIEAGGDMINMQQGLNSATIMDPSSSSQVSVMGRLFGLLGIILFLKIGGAYWTFNAFIRSFEIFPVYAHAVPLDEIINMPYLVKITSNVLYIGLQIASPVLIATLGQDIILGVINRTAQQIPVFQMSFMFKPGLGALVLIFIMPNMLNVIEDYFLSFANIF
ncbi:flagellar biosynthetic protein FliR [bacterium]|nr:flagellar biosynthetic protein FliR [bacterium]